MDNHISYEQIKNRECDFIVEYRFLSPEEGGRKTGNPAQGYRSDFMYSEDENLKKIWMIWPEFLDEDGQVILDKSIRVTAFGKAKMWIVNEMNQEFHKQKIKTGLKGFFMEGPHKVAECEVIQIVNLSLK
ncbi:hypothetical protein FLA105534_03588 [Flavobacterium bizetiae]|uniref:Uncharacterized protein n=1 Tax=Flavobacterium bizetiae TaxID=2704140 RepID=A0A6J4GV50_9FLAO|nr:hypothetical protein [Flavobacterium bizetiae]UTN05312.1 hypothetical protein L0669_05235 [Flavobacterium bizetiae]CAA9201445.1 hypothetical protein FLA105534_03588 [Flavobacterium bizetiae]CAD5343901.1 hypothetical protein FLA105535_03902 [Flavobacterium bizetiae]CAD5349664.1 hypothetical protein FLA105534_03651 [Flavobacterium bizetiae]